MSVTLLIAVLLGIGLALAATWLQRAERLRMVTALADRTAARRGGSEQRQLQHPTVDLSRCLGCATCVRACPEDGVLAMVHGQAMVVDGASCLGISACVRSCPADAISVGISGSATRTDLPAITPELEAIGSPGIFLAGEVTAQALIRVAIEHGTRVAATVSARVRAEPKHSSRPVDEPPSFDLCIVGAGPAGLACALEAKRLGLRFVVLDQDETIGGTVAKYPRRKLVLTEPVTLPLHGRVRKTEFSKEELIDFWQGLVDQHELPIAHGEQYERVQRLPGGFAVDTTNGRYTTRHVCLAIGRRGTPRTLGVPGEIAPHVSYSLFDAQSFVDSNLVVVGGGDSAAEAALSLAAQPGNHVVLAHRAESMPRLRRKNAARIEAAVSSGQLDLRLATEVTEISATRVSIRSTSPTTAPAMAATPTSAAPTSAAMHASTWASPDQRPAGHPTVDHSTADQPMADQPSVELAADHVFIFVGGTPPTELLESSGVSFDPALRVAATPEPTEQGPGLLRALVTALVLAVVTAGFAWWHADYYSLAIAGRPTHAKHELLRPGRGLGFWFGVGASVLIVGNLLYLLRRLPRSPLRLGSLSAWLNSHIATGVLALLLALLHSAFVAKSTPGGHALTALGVLMVTGAIGRYLYAAVPRAANGRELDLAEVRSELDTAIARSPQESGIDSRTRELIDEFAAEQQWQGSFVHRMVTAARQPTRLRRARAELAAEHPAASKRDLLVAFARLRRAQRAAVHAAYFEDVRTVLSTWRWLHRWVALIMVVLLVVHVAYALSYGSVWAGGSRSR